VLITLTSRSLYSFPTSRARSAALVDQQPAQRFPCLPRGFTAQDKVTSQLSAICMLRMSVESWFFSYPYLSKDLLLDDLRGEPEFDQILNIAGQRNEAFKNSFFR
jgi:hypothetical protein